MLLDDALSEPVSERIVARIGPQPQCPRSRSSSIVTGTL
jgi:hypothetical protein